MDVVHLHHLLVVLCCCFPFDFKISDGFMRNLDYEKNFLIKTI